MDRDNQKGKGETEKRETEITKKKRFSPSLSNRNNGNRGDLSDTNR